MSSAPRVNVSPMPPGVTNPDYKPPPGRLGNLTQSELKALETLRQRLQQHQPQDEYDFVFDPVRMNDAMLLRFLRARKFDVGKAEEMLLAAEKSRREHYKKMNGESISPGTGRLYPQYYHKTDKEGRPLYIEQLGKVNLSGITVTQSENQLQRLVSEYEKFLDERLPACSKLVGHPVETSCTVLDLADVSIGLFWEVKDFIYKAAQIGQDQYPECMGKFYIVNAPWTFGIAWSALKPFLDPVTREKIHVLNNKSQLLGQIPAENLPVELGGSCNCWNGCSFSDAGPWKDSKNNGAGKLEDDAAEELDDDAAGKLKDDAAEDDAWEGWDAKVAKMDVKDSKAENA